MNWIDNIIPKKKTNMNNYSLFPSSKKIKPCYRMPQKVYLRKTRGFNLDRFMDSDKDGVINGLDCYPFNRRKHGKYYHGTDVFGKVGIESRGIKTAKDINEENKRYGMDRDSRMSDQTDENYTYFFKKPHHAHSWAKVVAGHKNFIKTNKPVVMEADIEDTEMEREYNMPYGEAYKHKGSVPKEKVKEYKGDVSYPEDEIK